MASIKFLLNAHRSLDLQTFTQNRPVMKSQQKLVLGIAFFLTFQMAIGQSISRVEPPNWWVGMKNPNLQLMVYGEQIRQLVPTINFPGVTIKQVIQVENPNYLFIDLHITPQTQPGKIKLEFKDEEATVLTYDYELWERTPGSAERKGFDQSDVLYLITPDRFANGDPTNDNHPELREKADRSFKGGRHGGDIKGMLNHLDYIEECGFTAIWLNPLLENDQESYSYHGYSTTDFYKVDQRFGSNEAYLELVQRAREKGIGMIMDMIVNHCGSGHWWMNDLPTSDWLNSTENYVQTNHRKSVLQDPHVAAIDRKQLVDGWFVKTMPDLNQRNPLMANYLTQNSIWWIEYADLTGIRMDTYPYPDMDYMADWTRAVMKEYPNFNIVGEEWNGNPAIVSYWQKGKQNPNGYTSELKSLMDFPLQEALKKALKNEEGSDNSWIHLYEMLANDFLYASPEDLVVFPDNHDMNRLTMEVNNDLDLYKLGIAYILTTRGIPQIYYGSEIFQSHEGDGDHGLIRSDFPGGWPTDPINGFTGEGLSEAQKDVFEFFTKLLRWRKNNPVVHFGELTHFIPQDDVYVYFRHSDAGKVMVILNKNEEPNQLSLERFQEMLVGINSGKEILTGQTIELGNSVVIPGRTPMVLELE